MSNDLTWAQRSALTHYLTKGPVTMRAVDVLPEDRALEAKGLLTIENEPEKPGFRPMVKVSVTDRGKAQHAALTKGG